MTEEEKEKLPFVPPYIDHEEESIARFGRRLMQAINLRIAYESAVIKMYQNQLARLQSKVGNQHFNEKREKELNHRITNENFFKLNYESLRQQMYDAVDELLHDEGKFYRETYKAVFLDGYDYKQTAKKLNISENTIKNYVNRITAEYLYEKPKKKS